MLLKVFIGVWRCQVSFETMFWLICVKNQAIEVQKGLWADSTPAPPPACGQTEKPGLNRVYITLSLYFDKVYEQSVYQEYLAIWISLQCDWKYVFGLTLQLSQENEADNMNEWTKNTQLPSICPTNNIFLGYRVILFFYLRIIF